MLKWPSLLPSSSQVHQLSQHPFSWILWGCGEELQALHREKSGAAIVLGYGKHGVPNDGAVICRVGVGVISLTDEDTPKKS